MRKEKEWKCPKCGKITKEFPALSRKDNSTEICGTCGIEESLLAMGVSKENMPKIKKKMEEQADHIVETFQKMFQEEYFTLFIVIGARSQVSEDIPNKIEEIFEKMDCTIADRINVLVFMLATAVSFIEEHSELLHILRKLTIIKDEVVNESDEK